MIRIFVCPKCDQANIVEKGVPNTPPGTPCEWCGALYYLGQQTDENIETVDDIPWDPNLTGEIDE